MTPVTNGTSVYIDTCSVHVFRNAVRKTSDMD